MKTISNAEQQLAMVLAGGDDYELCFTVSDDKCHELYGISERLNLEVTEIGAIEEERGLRLLKNGVNSELLNLGYEHFSK